jgi:hypothetical protein
MFETITQKDFILHPSVRIEAANPLHLQAQQMFCILVAKLPSNTTEWEYVDLQYLPIAQ